MPTARVADVDIAYDIAGPEHAPPVLMINGLGADRPNWGLQVPALSEHFRVVTFDNRDVGQTGAGRKPHSYGMRQFADDAAGLLDHLGIARAHIVGASMGGTIAQEFALAYPERTAGLAIVCSWAKTDPWLAELFTDWEGIFAAQGQRAFARTSWLWVFTHRFYNTPGNLQTLSAGAPVVHEEYGVGRYVGLQVMEVGGQSGEFLVLEYQGGDRRGGALRPPRRLGLGGVRTGRVCLWLSP